MSTAICPYCEPDTAGRHAANCPNNYRPEQSARYISDPPTFFQLPDLEGLNRRIDQKLDQIQAMLRPGTIQGAKMTIWESLQNDPRFKDVYVSNIAMLIHDRLGGVEYGLRNGLANEILDLLFKPDAPTSE